MSRRLTLFGLVFALAVLVGSPSQVSTPAHAQSVTSGGMSSAIRMAASGLSPVPANSILSPDALDRIAEQVRAVQWQLPPDDAQWPTHRGEPLVDTPQADELWHTVERGQTLFRIRQMYRQRTSRLAELNPGVDLDELEEGQELLVWKRRDDAISKSYGAAHRGRLYNAEPLPFSENYVILYPHRTFGTYYTVSEVRRVMDEFYAKYPEAHKLIIGDISFRTGRAIHPHRSHESGRDIDISYPRHEPPPNFRRFHYVRRDNLHVPRTLDLMKSLIDGGQVEYIFMDRYFQKMLRAEALERGAPRQWVERVFQYPHWSGGDAIIRHSRGHRNHFHVRFKCQQTDRRCR